MPPVLEPVSPMAGVTIVELTTFGFVPSGAAILADWGANVIKIEHPRIQDPMRGLVCDPDVTGDGEMVDTMMDQLNRGKRNIALDLTAEDGLALFYSLIAKADIFITSFLPPAQEKLKITYEQLRAINPTLIYAHGHGQGQRGPDAAEPGFDGLSYWTRGGVGHALTMPGGQPAQQRRAFGDVMGGLSLAGGISAALYNRRVTGQGCTVDVSLLAVACWQLAPDIIASALLGQDLREYLESMDLPAAPPPLATKDNRLIRLAMLGDHYWPRLLNAIGLGGLLQQPEFADSQSRRENFAEMNERVKQRFSEMTLAEARAALEGRDVPWAFVQTAYEVLSDRQVVANEYVLRNPADARQVITTSPIQFNHRPPPITQGAPRQGEHTEEILLELGEDPRRIAELRERGVIAVGDESTWNRYGSLGAEARIMR